MNIWALKYVSPIVVYALALCAFSRSGWITFLPVAYAFGVIPLLELWLRPDPRNLDAASAELARHDKVYDLILYAFVLLQLGTVVYFLSTIGEVRHDILSLVGRTASLGLLCGSFGINIGHELGHRTNSLEKVLAKFSLLTSLYMHFFIEHNKGHHKNVGTFHDPGTARWGESLYRFWPRAIVHCYRNAWKIANREMKLKGRRVFYFSNEMLQMQVGQLSVVATIGLVFGGMALASFLAASLIGILLLETVNYIEHYGLQRKILANGQYERPLPVHSWNSNHIMGRMLLFELSRHSDHHYLASRKYQVLQHHDEAPQMPTGYPGMMLLSLLPPLWFYVMHRHIRQLSAPLPGG